jgi:hypothetical protein
MQAYIHEFAVPVFGLVMTFDELIDHQQHFVWPIVHFNRDIYENLSLNGVAASMVHQSC